MFNFLLQCGEYIPAKPSQRPQWTSGLTGFPENGVFVASCFTAAQQTREKRQVKARDRKCVGWIGAQKYLQTSSSHTFTEDP